MAVRFDVPIVECTLATWWGARDARAGGRSSRTSLSAHRKRAQGEVPPGARARNRRDGRRLRRDAPQWEGLCRQAPASRTFPAPGGAGSLSSRRLCRQQGQAPRGGDAPLEARRSDLVDFQCIARESLQFRTTRQQSKRCAFRRLPPARCARSCSRVSRAAKIEPRTAQRGPRRELRDPPARQHTGAHSCDPGSRIDQSRRVSCRAGSQCGFGWTIPLDNRHTGSMFTS